jgi:hypothetical protein
MVILGHPTAMNLYRRNISQASVAVLLAALAAGGVAQSLRRKPHQLRATSLAEVTVDSHGITTARLIPITILDDGSFHDATIYKNEPQPMVLDQGVVYEVQKTGLAVGYVTVGKAVKDKEKGWTALGKWQPASPPATKASATPTPSNPTDERPVLHRPGASGSTSPSASPTVTPTPAPSDNGSSDRPVLHRPENAATPTPTPAGTASPAATAPDPAAQAETRDEPVDPDRPTLRRRTPQSAGDSSQSREIAPAATSPQTKASPPPPQLSNTSGTQSLVAVSDAQPGDSRSYQFIWKPGEEPPIDAKLRRLALAQLAGQVSDSSLSNVVIRSFDLDLSNDAVMVITAEAPPLTAGPAKSSQSAAAGKTPATPGATRYVTVIARVDFEGNPQKLASSVTDASRFDVAPRLELIDAVDVDGDGFGELLFREYGFGETSFVIYQIGRSTVTKLFEGASQSMK